MAVTRSVTSIDRSGGGLLVCDLAPGTDTLTLRINEVVWWTVSHRNGSGLTVRMSNGDVISLMGTAGLVDAIQDRLRAMTLAPLHTGR